MKNSFIILITLILINLTLSIEKIQFEIYKQFINDPHNTRRINLGTLQVTKNLEYNQIQSYIRPNFPQLVSENDIKQTSVVLSFVPKSGKNINQNNIVFKTSVVEKLSGSQDQIIGVIIGVDNNIKAINYLEKRSPLRQIKAQIIKMQPGKQQFTKMQMTPKKPGTDGAAPQDQSFFSKYKWPLIIGAVVLYLSSMTDKQGGQPGAGPAAR